MKKPRIRYDCILFALLMVFLFVPIIQEWGGIFPVKPLNGFFELTSKPELTFDNYRSNTYQVQIEKYSNENFGLREPIIRLYNQYLWTCYKKTYTHDVVAGKDGWLYYPQSVSDYYGKELLKWQPSVEEAKKNFDLDVKYLHWARTILKENGIELMVFMAPEKGQVYPEYLPDAEHDSSTFNACNYFADQFEKVQFPCIEMTRWFKQMKDTVPYLLIPQTGGHWNFSSVYAADSLFRYMESLKGINMPKISIGALHESDKSAYEAETDLEQLLNLSFPIRQRQKLAPEAEVSIKSDSGTVKPKVLFIGNSFFWRIAHYIPLDEMFEKVEFWYYFSTAYYGEGLKQTRPIDKMDLLEHLLDFDYVVWFTTGNQMVKGTAGFAQIAAINLCINSNLLQTHILRLADSLSVSPWQAKTLLFEHPDLFPELRGDSLKVRNEDIPYAKITKDIRKDSIWMAALEAQAFLRTAHISQMLHAEADRVIQGKPLYRDQQAEILFGWRCQQEVEELMPKMLNEPKTMEIIEKQAIEKGKTLEKSLRDNAEWLIRHKYKLDTCRLLDNPDAEIPLPPNPKLN